VNKAGQFFRRHAFAVCLLIAALVVIALGGSTHAALGLALIPCLGTVLTEEEFQSKVIGATDETKRGLTEIRTAHDALGKRLDGELADVKKVINEQTTLLNETRKRSLTVNSFPRRQGAVSEDCARHLGGLAVLAGLRGKQLAGDRWEGIVKDVLGLEVRTALTVSDIPIPTQWGAEVVELVGQFGAARQYGTVYPLGAGTVKLPKLGTDTTFGLIAGSGTVTEKSPTVSFVTFSPEKFGGLVRLPTELDEDSIVQIGQFVARYSARQIAYIEDYNFFRSTGAGSGSNGTAEGLTKNVVTDSKTVALASTKTAISDATLAKFRELRTKPDAAALRMGAYYLHPSLEQMLSAFNSSGDKPYQANGLNGATLDGFPIRWVDVMPVYSTSAAASTVFALFGDTSFQYLGVRGGIRFDTSTEAGFTTDEILIRALERFTVGKMATGAVAGLITAAS
jgi:HK97 family phage major capsid protein